MTVRRADVLEEQEPIRAGTTAATDTASSAAGEAVGPLGVRTQDFEVIGGCGGDLLAHACQVRAARG